MLMFVVCSGPLLPDYLLNFGPVVSGTTEQKTIAATNVSCFPISFDIDQCKARCEGFTALIDNVRELPPGDNVNIIVVFDPRAITTHNCRMESTMLINVCIFHLSSFFHYIFSCSCLCL